MLTLCVNEALAEFAVTLVSSAVTFPEPGRMVAFSNQVRSKSAAVQSTRSGEPSQLMFQVELVASDTVSATVG